MTKRNDPNSLEYSLEFVRSAGGQSGYRNYPGCGGIWAGRNNEIADGNFTDWGLGRAAAVILNAVHQGRLVPLADGEEAPAKKAEIVECSRCGAPVPFGSCCDECDEPTDH